MISSPFFRPIARRRTAAPRKALLRVEALETRFCPSGTTTALVTSSPENATAIETNSTATPVVGAPTVQVQQPATVLDVEEGIVMQTALPEAVPVPTPMPVPVAAPIPKLVTVITPDAAAAVFALEPVASTPTLDPVVVRDMGQVAAMEEEDGEGSFYCMSEEESDGFAITQFTARQNSETSWTFRGQVVNMPAPQSPIEIIFGGIDALQGQNTFADASGYFEYTVNLPANASGTVTAQAMNGTELTVPVMTVIGNNQDPE